MRYNINRLQVQQLNVHVVHVQPRARTRVASIDQLFLEQIIGKAFLRLEAVVLTPRHGEGNADARLDVQELAQGGQAVGVDQQRVVLHFDVVVQDRQRLVELTHRQFRARQLLF